MTEASSHTKSSICARPCEASAPSLQFTLLRERCFAPFFCAQFLEMDTFVAAVHAVTALA
ncbi:MULTISPECIES: hypothetical protein [Burkholderiaceae]|uniref:hypothetical protein n=1 Tax=Burkholderiaceae TaxID=119060 RepID=UPI000962B479|nr:MULTISPECIES: hypothetical protein [Burkholderiaceae]MCG1039037.1 hypothetical protein [Mycetohabitans sp. B7]SIT66909.1 hypothetical protein SAMN04487769_0980 [Burkholderia sp. b14]